MYTFKKPKSNSLCIHPQYRGNSYRSKIMWTSWINTFTSYGGSAICSWHLPHFKFHQLQILGIHIHAHIDKVKNRQLTSRFFLENFQNSPTLTRLRSLTLHNKQTSWGKLQQQTAILHDQLRNKTLRRANSQYLWNDI